MPTLTIDLPEAEYRAALALPEAERVRRAASVFAVAKNPPSLPRGMVTPLVSDPAMVARFRAEAKAASVANAALRAEWEVEAERMTSQERADESRWFAQHMVNMNESRATGERQLYSDADIDAGFAYAAELQKIADGNAP